MEMRYGLYLLPYLEVPAVQKAYQEYNSAWISDMAAREGYRRHRRIMGIVVPLVGLAALAVTAATQAWAGLAVLACVLGLWYWSSNAHEKGELDVSYARLELMDKMLQLEVSVHQARLAEAAGS
jgi:hypothetical protein